MYLARPVFSYLRLAIYDYLRPPHHAFNSHGDNKIICTYNPPSKFRLSLLYSPSAWHAFWNLVLYLVSILIPPFCKFVFMHMIPDTIYGFFIYSTFHLTPSLLLRA